MEYTEKDLSQWFDVEKQKPWEDGVYEVRSSSLAFRNIFSLFRNGTFHEISVVVLEPTDRIANVGVGDGCTVTHWRGLNHKPSAPKPKANKRKTMYVVVNVRTFRPCAAFDKVNEARDYAERVKFPVRVIRTRFRVHA